MKDYQIRVVDEYSDLEERTGKLEEFLQSDKFAEVSVQERSYLEAQLPLMQKLLAVLKSRCEMYALEVEEKPAEEEQDA